MGSPTRVPEAFKTLGPRRPMSLQKEAPPSDGRLAQAAGCQKAAKRQKAAPRRADSLQAASREAGS